MTLIELKNHIDSILKHATPNNKTHLENLRVCIDNGKPCAGGTSVTNIKKINQGFDSDKGMLFIIPEKAMVERELDKQYEIYNEVLLVIIILFEMYMRWLDIKKIEEPDYTKGYVVITETIEQVNIVSSHIKKERTDWSAEFKHVIFEPGNPGSTLYNDLYPCYSNYPVLTFTEFEQKILKPSQLNQNQEKMKKKIIGRKVPDDFKYWGLKKDQQLLIPVQFGDSKQTYIVNDSAIPIELFDSWEPVYEIEIESKVFRLGTVCYGFDVIVQNGKCFHNTDDITSFVIELVEIYEKTPQKIGEYDCILGKITFTKTGCENIETTLTEWKEVYAEIKKQKP